MALGNAVCERLAVLLPDVHVEAFMPNMPNKHKLYRNYLTELHNGRVLYPAGPMTQRSSEYLRFIQQHLDLDKYHSGSYVMVKNTDADGHDDYPDSAALMAWGEKFVINGELGDMPEVEMSDYWGQKPGYVDPRGRAMHSRSDRYRRRW
jgi:hypothetical protein